MNVLEPTLEHARRELAGIADALSEDDDLVVAYARAVWSCLVEPGDRVAGALIATCGPVRALEIAVATTGGAEVAHAAGIELGELDKARTRWRAGKSGAQQRRNAQVVQLAEIGGESLANRVLRRISHLLYAVETEGFSGDD